MSSELAGQSAVISGGLGDIGRAIALELASHGADIAVCDLNAALSDALRQRIEGLGRRYRFDRVDVSDAQAVSAWIADLESRFVLPTLIIPNAAIVDERPFSKLDAQWWRKELSVNLDGAFNVAHAATSRLIAKGLPGRVVFVGSWAADTVHTQIPTYCVAKAAVRMLARCMAGAFASAGILVNEVAPGYVDAGLANKWVEADPTVRENSRREVPIGALIEPEEVARQVWHLCDPRNRHMTGTTLLMDGGLTLVRPAAS
jgi:glucose 1-dehydrogenase